MQLRRGQLLHFDSQKRARCRTVAGNDGECHRAVWFACGVGHGRRQLRRAILIAEVARRLEH